MHAGGRARVEGRCQQRLQCTRAGILPQRWTCFSSLASLCLCTLNQKLQFIHVFKHEYILGSQVGNQSDDAAADRMCLTFALPGMRAGGERSRSQVQRKKRIVKGTGKDRETLLGMRLCLIAGQRLKGLRWERSRGLLRFEPAARVLPEAAGQRGPCQDRADQRSLSRTCGVCGWSGGDDPRLALGTSCNTCRLNEGEICAGSMPGWSTWAQIVAGWEARQVQCRKSPEAHL